jgi:hypothetical protein
MRGVGVSRDVPPGRSTEQEVTWANAFLDAQRIRQLSLRSLGAYGYDLLHFARWWFQHHPSRSPAVVPRKALRGLPKALTISLAGVDVFESEGQHIAKLFITHETTSAAVAARAMISNIDGPPASFDYWTGMRRVGPGNFTPSPSQIRT